MLTRNFQAIDCIVYPDEIAHLQRIFDDFCAAKGIEHDSLAATDTAFFLIAIYQSGVTDEERLRLAIGLQGADA